VGARERGPFSAGTLLTSCRSRAAPPPNPNPQVWKATVYLTPVLGAFLADAYMGRWAAMAAAPAAAARTASAGCWPRRTPQRLVLLPQEHPKDRRSSGR
jgi:hypothetical protein